MIVCFEGLSSPLEILLRGDRIKTTREALGLSQRELAHLCGLGTNQIHRYENGKSDISGTYLAIIAKKLGVSADYLLGLSDDPHGILSPVDLNLHEQDTVDALRRDGWLGVIRLATDRLAKN